MTAIYCYGTVDLDLRLVRYAVVLADELHFARAADRLMIAQQTLSAQISSLETRLGVALFVRDRRHVELTPQGELFVRRGRALLAESQDLLTELCESAPSLRLDVITEGLTSGIVAKELRPRLTDVTLEVIQGQGFAATLTGVAEGRVDLAFGRVHGTGRPLPSNLRHELVRWEPVGVVLPDGHPLVKRARVPMDELAGYPLVLHTAEEATEWEAWNVELAAAFGLTFGWRLHGHGRGAANAAVLAYQAPSFGPLEAPVPEGVVVRPVIAPVPLYPFSVIWRSGRTSLALRRAVTAIHEIADEHGWLVPPKTDWWLPADERP
ncbi:LysR family transcriptional regulator [Streptomyces sp. NPDC057002]|uniref:LysR family transcriptional regulator n=1 Tax=Streptomyces sp. NPDC057002 TaxID=3345992 RepID=UPI00363E8237